MSNINDKANSYVCSSCAAVVTESANICPSCGENFGKEISEKEIVDILKKGPDKAYTFLVALFEDRNKEKVLSLGAKLIKRFPDSNQAKWTLTLMKEAKELPPKKIKYNKTIQKFCPNCKKILEMSQGICKCGYNFNEPNIEAISLIKQKRITSNRVIGITMILIGTIFLILHWPSELLQKDTSMDKFIYGIPVLLVIIGIYKLVSGNTLKKPTNSPFDYILGDPDGKAVDDDIPFTFCISCGKQILKELNNKICPHCQTKIK